MARQPEPAGQELRGPVEPQLSGDRTRRIRMRREMRIMTRRARMTGTRITKLGG